MNRCFSRALFLTVAFVVLASQSRLYGQSALRLIKGTDYTYSGLVPQVGGAIPDVSSWSWVFSIKPYGSRTLDSDASDALFSTGTNSATNPAQGGYSFIVPAAMQAPLNPTNYKLTVYANGTGMVGKIAGGTLSVTIPTTSSGTLDLTPSLGGIATDTTLDQGQTTTLGQIMTGVNNTNATLGNVGSGVTSTNTNLNNAITQLNALQASVNALASATPTPTPSPTPNRTSGPYPDGTTLHGIPGAWAASDYDFGTPGISSAAAYFSNAGTGALTYRTDSGNANLKTNTDSIAASPWVTGNAAVVGTLFDGSYMVYSCAVATTRTYDIQLRVETNYTIAKVHVEADGVPITASTTVQQTFTSGAWDVAANWATFDLGNVTLTAKPAGVATAIKIVVDTGYVDINEIAFINSTATGATIAGSPVTVPALSGTVVASASGTAPTVGQWVKAGNATFEVVALGTPAGGNTPVTLFNGGAAGNSGVTSLPVGTTLAVQGAAPITGQYYVSGTGGPYIYGLAQPPTDPTVSGNYSTTGSTGAGGAGGPANITWPIVTAEPTAVAANPSQPTNPAGNNEYWVAVRSDSAGGTGTPSDPFNLNTAAKFTAFIKNTAPSNTTVHFAKGTYVLYRSGDDTNSEHTRTIRPGNIFLGAGMDQTIFNPGSVDDNLVGQNDHVWMDFASNSSGFQLWDCTTDCSAHTDVAFHYQATFAEFSGNNIRFDRCKVIGFGGHGTFTDSFGTWQGGEIFLFGNHGGGGPAGTISNNIIDRCIITQFDADTSHGIDGITTTYMDGSRFDKTNYFSNCRFYNYYTRFSYSQAFGTDPNCFGNYVSGVDIGMYQEPNGSTLSTDTWVHDNYLDVQRAWFLLFPPTGLGSRYTAKSIFDNNIVIMERGGVNLGGFSYALGGALNGAAPQMAEIDIRNNTFTMASPSDGIRLFDPGTGMKIGTLILTGNKFIGTTTGQVFRITKPSITVINQSANVDGNGNPLSF